MAWGKHRERSLCASIAADHGCAHPRPPACGVAVQGGGGGGTCSAQRSPAQHSKRALPSPAAPRPQVEKNVKDFAANVENLVDKVVSGEWALLLALPGGAAAQPCPEALRPPGLLPCCTASAMRCPRHTLAPSCTAPATHAGSARPPHSGLARPPDTSSARHWPRLPAHAAPSRPPSPPPRLSRQASWGWSWWRTSTTWSAASCGELPPSLA